MDIFGYGLLGVIIAALLAFDLYSHRGGETVTIKSATLWSLFYIAAALGFGAYINFAYSTEWAQLYLTGYALEKVLAVDNLFAFMMIFAYFGVDPKHQHRILYWGILGAIVFRGIFVALGTGFTALFGPWAELIFAAIIGYTAVKMLAGGGDDGDDEVDYNQAWYVRILGRFLPITGERNGGDFFARIKDNSGKLALFATPMFVCLVAIEISDIVFAFDSVPAVIAVTQEPYLVYAAMIFAILGLRSLYFVLDALKRSLTRLETMVIVILGFIAAKLGAAAGSKLAISWGLVDWKEPLHLDPMHSLAIVLGLLATGVIWSIVHPKAEA